VGDPPDPDVVSRIVAELADVPRGPIDEDREPPLPMDGEGDEALDEAGRCLAQALAVLDAVHRLATRWEAAGDQARADELRSAVRAAISEATDEAGRTDVRH